MELNKLNVDELTEFSVPKDMHNSDQLYIQEKKLYKLFRNNSFILEKERNVDFLINHRIPNTPVIYEKLYKDGEFGGYVMEYLLNSHTFRSSLGQNVSLDKKIKAIRGVYEALKAFHEQNIYLGDIHSDNLLITESGDGYIVDLEEIRFLGDEYKFKQCYLVCPNYSANKINVASKYTDNIKVMISSLSLLLDYDLEKYISKTDHSINLEQLYKDVVLPLNQIELNEYFCLLMQGEDVPYFSDYFFPLDRELHK